MALNLSVVKSPAGVTLASSQQTFGEEGGTIGRGDGNNWVLSDPDRFLSSRHCAVTFEGGQYYLTDTSTNGTFINSAPEPIGKGGKIPVNDGDSIELGDYQFKVSLQADVGGLPNDPFDAGFGAAASNASNDVFANNDPFAASPPPLEQAPPQTSPFDDPFGSPAPSAGGGLGQDLDLGTPVGSEPESVDPLAALDKAGGPGPQQGFDSLESPPGFGDPFASPAPAASSQDVFGQSPSAAQDPFAASTMGDSGNAMNQSVEWPEAKGDNLIPEDWEEDLLGGGPAQPAVMPPTMTPSMTPPPAPAVPTPRPQSPPPQQRPLASEVSGAHRSMPLTDPPKRQAAAQRDESLLAERAPERVESFQSKPRAEVKPRSAARPKTSSAAAMNIGQALLDGMGMSDENVTEQELARMTALIGELMPVIIEGMMQVLRSRASIKNEFRMNVTTIQPVENNPLKFSANAHEAIENMFLRNSDAYMAPKQAFKEGFDGIGEHQVAIIAGIRAAFKSMMDRFNPEKLERQFDKQNKGVMLPGMQKNKYWNSYGDYYNGFVDNMENSFQYLFGDEFVQAYEDQLRRLAFERKQKQHQE